MTYSEASLFSVGFIGHRGRQFLQAAAGGLCIAATLSGCGQIGCGQGDAPPPPPGAALPVGAPLPTPAMPTPTTPTAVDENLAVASPAPAVPATDPAAVPAPSPGATPVAPTPGGPAGNMPPPEFAQGAEGLAAIGAALQEAANAQAAGGTSCEQAYNGAAAMVRVMHEQMGDQVPAQLPSRPEFLAACATLPEEMQRCLIVSYAMSHGQECQQAQQRVDPAIMRRVDELMRKSRPVR